MSENAATQPGAAEGAQPTDRPIFRPSRQEVIEAIHRKRIDDFNKEQKEAGSDDLLEHSAELGRKTDESADEEDQDDVDQDDRAAEEEKKRLEAEALAQEDRDSKKAKAEFARQLAEDDRVTVIDDPSKYRVKGKVDGEEVEVSLTDAVRAVQKEKAADRRMEQAALAMKEAERVRAEVDAKLKAADEEVSKAKTARDAEAVKVAEAAREKARANLAETVKRHAELLYDGKVEEASKVMQELLEPVYERPTPTPEKAPAVDVSAITKQVTEAVSKRLKTEGALDAFAKDYPEIIANERLSNMADSFYDAAVKDGKSHEDALKHAGNATRQEVRELAKSLGMSETKPKTTDGRESREKRKGEIDEVEAASSARPLRDTDSEPSTSNARSVIAEMARTRPGAAAAAAAEKARSGG